MKMKFPELIVAVAEKRQLGIEALMKEHHPPRVIIMDDAYQHRSVRPGLSILVMDYYRPVYRDLCLPAGNLREPVSGKKRADIIMVSKCPEDLSLEERDQIIARLTPTPDQKVFFSTIQYDLPQKLFEQEGAPREQIFPPLPESGGILALAGIGNPRPFFNHVKHFRRPVTTLPFPDHYEFTQRGIKRMENKLKEAGPDTVILTTEKDAVKLRHTPLPSSLKQKIWYLPIQLKILFNDENTFKKTVKAYVRTNQRNG
jgi:tetraacyldisaccharide 4'-kinase